MSRHLNEHDIERIVELLDGWKGKLTWELLCDACERTINTRPTRQTLAKFQRIAGAYKAVKERGREEVESKHPSIIKCSRTTYRKANP